MRSKSMLLHRNDELILEISKLEKSRHLLNEKFSRLENELERVKKANTDLLKANETMKVENKRIMKNLLMLNHYRKVIIRLFS